MFWIVMAQHVVCMYHGTTTGQLRDCAEFDESDGVRGTLDRTGRPVFENSQSCEWCPCGNTVVLIYSTCHSSSQDGSCAFPRVSPRAPSPRFWRFLSPLPHALIQLSRKHLNKQWTSKKRATHRRRKLCAYKLQYYCNRNFSHFVFSINF